MYALEHMLPPCDKIVVAIVCFMHYSIANSRTSERRERFSIIHCVYCCYEKWIYSGSINSLQLQYETTSIYHHTGLHQTKYLLVPQNVLKPPIEFRETWTDAICHICYADGKECDRGILLVPVSRKNDIPEDTYTYTYRNTNTHTPSLIPKIPVVTMSCHSPK